MRSPAGGFVLALFALAAGCARSAGKATTTAEEADAAPAADTASKDAPAPDLARLAVDAAGAADGPAPIPGDAGVGQWSKLATPGIASVHALVLDQAGNLYTGSRSNTYLRSVAPPADALSPGIFRSPDRGDTWTPASLGLFDYEVMALAADGGTLFAAAGHLMRSKDSGASWASVAQPNRDPYSSVAAAQGLVLAAVDDFSAPALVRSEDGGDHFAKVVLQEMIGHVAAIALRPPLVLIGHGSGVHRSTDRGLNFAPAVFPYTGPFSLAFRQLVLADDTTGYGLAGALHRSVDAGRSWQRLTFDADPMVAATALAASASQLLVAGLRGVPAQRQAFLRLSTDRGQTWRELPIQPTSELFALHIDGTTFLAGSAAGLQRSTDGGATWSWANGPAGPPARSRTVRVDDLAIDDTSHSLHPEGDLYAVIGNAVWRSTDAAASWKALAIPAMPDTCTVLASGAILCGGYRSTDHGETWTEMQFIGRQRPVRFAGHGPLVWALAANAPWRSEDDGQSWTRATMLDDRPGNLAVNRAGVVFHGTKRSLDKGTTWQELGHRVTDVDAADRLYENTNVGQSLAVSEDGGVTWKPLMNVTFPARIGAMLVGRDDRIWLQVHDEEATPPDRLLVRAPGGAWTSVQEGLGHALAHRLAFDRIGRLHAATNGGVYRMVTGP